MHTHPQLLGHQSSGGIICQQDRSRLLVHQSQCLLLTYIKCKSAKQGHKLGVSGQHSLYTGELDLVLIQCIRAMANNFLANTFWHQDDKISQQIYAVQLIGPASQTTCVGLFLATQTPFDVFLNVPFH